MYARQVERLDLLVLVTGAASRAEVIRNALKSYAVLVDAVQDGGKIVKVRDSERVEVELLGVGL